MLACTQRGQAAHCTRWMLTDDLDDRPEVLSLFGNLRTFLPSLERLLDRCNDHWVGEDGVYRFYHQSLKVYSLQGATTSIVAALQALAPDRPLNEWFAAIVRDGTERVFKPEHNVQWLSETRPIVEAFFHAKYFLEIAVRYGRTLESPPRRLPSGWAAFLYLYNLR